MKYGEIVELGPHRLMCGDATKAEDVFALVGGERVDLVLTDPPYGVNIVRTGGWMKPYKDMIGDTSTNTARLNYPIVHSLTDRLIIWGGQYFTDFLPISPAWLVWDKVRSNKFSFSSCELAWTTVGGRKNWYYKQYWNGCWGKKSPLNPCPHIHPTQKPVELHARILEDFTQPDDVILDCFGGSGTTLIASEITGRRCLMMEISPDYCDIIRERYQKLMREGFTLWNS